MDALLPIVLLIFAFLTTLVVSLLFALKGRWYFEKIKKPLEF